MLLVVSRILLFSLLALEWAGDPYAGLAEISAPCHSEEVLPIAMRHRHVISKAIESGRQVTHVASSAPRRAVCRSIEPVSDSRPGSPRPLLYVLMSLTC